MGKVDELHLLQQNMQQILMQKQQVESSLTELQSALSEIEKTDKAYRILGKIMVAGSTNEIKNDLAEQKELLELRLKNVVKQEKQIQEKIKSAQDGAVKELKNE